MNETSPRKTTNAGRNNPRAGNIAAPAATKSPGKPDSKLDFPLDAAKVHAIFRNDTSVRQAITANLKKRSAESKVIAERARAAFKNFDPSNLSRAERTRRNYVAPGGQLAKTQLAVINRGVEAIRSSKIKPSITIHNSGELKDLIKETPGTDPSLVGTMELEPFFNFITLRPDASPSPVYTLCKAELDGQKKLDEIQIPALPKDNDESTGDDSPLKPRTASKLVEDTVNLQMETATSPEAQLQYSRIPNNADKDKVQSGLLQTFELRAGASDVTSYHDFSRLQIAFEHVWTEIFDARLASLGQELYHECVKFMSLTGNGGVIPTKISTLRDLSQLMADIKTLSRDAQQNAPNDSFHDSGEVIAGHRVSIDFGNAATSGSEKSTAVGDVLTTGSERLDQLLKTLEKLLSEQYAFDVFAKDSKNFGIMVTYRQTWEPQNYQVGDLVSTIPLGPKEIRRYTTRAVSKKTRAVKELEDNLQTRKTESSDTSRADKEIVDKAQEKTNFNVTAHESFGGEGYTIDSTQSAGGDNSHESARVKKDFRESVLKSAQEYRQQNRTEIDTSESQETESTTFNEIQNPNDELAVTYLFYELQRTYKISERIHALTPVILVANEVPSPDGIDDAWLVEHDWILRRVILDDSFRPALNYLKESFVGAELNIRILDENAKGQKNIVDDLKQQIRVQTADWLSDQQDVLKAVQNLGSLQNQKDAVNAVKRVFDPLGITGEAGKGAIDAAQAMVDYAKETLDRADREKARLLSQLELANTALQKAVDKLSSAIKEHYNKVVEIDRLRVHVKENILYYMQAIWRHEPPDQRFFRLYNIDVPWVEAKTAGATIPLRKGRDFSDLVSRLRGKDTLSASLPMPKVTVTTKKLVEVADLDNVLAYKGNYMVFALKENNYITLHMMQDYLEVGDELILRDPDEFGNYTVDDLQALATCMNRSDPESFKKYREKFKQAIIDRLSSPRKDSELVIVPTTSLYIECLVGTHPLLEDFKLIHRALDVKKVQAEVRHAELENIRLASRALKGKDEDPDIEKKIVIETDTKNLTIQPGN